MVNDKRANHKAANKTWASSTLQGVVTRPRSTVFR